MRVFLDTEFMEDGHTIDLISIGMVREDGRELYVVSQDFNRSRAESDEWLKRNVLAYIPMDFDTVPHDHIRYLVEDFLFDEEPEFWANYCAYDWVAFAQLWGKMFELPPGWPRYCNDLQQLASRGNHILPTQRGIQHHALADARWVKEAFDYCTLREAG